MMPIDFAYPVGEQRRVLLLSEEIIDGERVLCIAIQDPAEHAKPEPVEQASDNVTISKAKLMQIARMIIAEELPDCDEEFMSARAHGVGSFHSEILSAGQQAGAVDGERDARLTMQGMADCMDMVRGELIEAGIISKGVAPMFIANAVCAHIAAIEKAHRGAAGEVSDQDLLKLTCLHTGKRVSLTVAECFEHIDFGRAAIASANQKGDVGAS